MQNEKQFARTLGKLKNLESIIEAELFIKNTSIDSLEIYKTYDRLHKIPESGFEPVDIGGRWGELKQYAWVRASYTVPEELDGQRLFIRPRIGFYEAMLWVNGTVRGTFANKIIEHSHGNHYCNMLINKAEAGETIQILLECYAGHDFAGTQPFTPQPPLDVNYYINGFDICIKDELLCDFYFNLKTMNELIATTPDIFRKGQLMNTAAEVHKTILYCPELANNEDFRNSVTEANNIIKKSLALQNGESAPSCGIIGHSHMDTAWLWEIGETVKKCARTYSNQLSLMEQYAEYTFIQSSSYHSEMMRRHYPELFERIKQAVADKRYEPNGGVYVECDCNITSGESIIRQFLWGQRFTQEHFNYRSNVFWLPDTFGYSAAIPQIMKGCGVDYFLTTKMEWNDTNVFPFDTFYWKGIDGTTVFSHLNRIHIGPTPQNLLDISYGTNGQKGIMQPSVTNKRLLSFGKGDGGGGPEFEMLEMARRAKDTAGCPKAEYTLVSDFMHKLEESAVDCNIFKGELYLELHRGTLTGHHTIKRQNRKAETALHNAELMIVKKAVAEKTIASGASLRDLTETLLVNQFHDILPGTSIPEVNDKSYSDMAQVIAQAKAIADSVIVCEPTNDCYTILNTLGFSYKGPLHVPYCKGKFVDINRLKQQYNQAACQLTTDFDGNQFYVIHGISIPAFGSITVYLADSATASSSAFRYTQNSIETPYAKVTFDKSGFISSFIDKRNSRELVSGRSLNTFLMAEDMPMMWDNWDIDSDIEPKLKPCATLISRDVVSDGAVEFRLRSVYALSAKSTLTQDMVFYAASAQVDFITRIDWHDKRRLLKTAFDTDICANFARQEVQFGYVERPTTRNNSIEQAKFETLNHKYSDISETGYGISILNDCKYGISIQEGRMSLTLIKSGLRPDPRGDEGLHDMTYSFLPHTGGFSSENVILPAYMLNNPPIVTEGKAASTSLATIAAPNIIIETVKPCEDAECAFILRIYEAEGTYTRTELSLPEAFEVSAVNMLEECYEELGAVKDIELIFRPFEIKTLKVRY